MAEVATASEFHGKRTLAVSLPLAALGFGVLALGWSQARVPTLFAYLTAFCFVTAVALGGLIFLMTGYVVRATWSVVLRRLNESIIDVFPLLALLFLPIGANLPALYSWVHPEQSFAHSELALLRHKASYLNPAAFQLRTAGYFALWIVTAALLRRASRRHDSNRASRLSAALLPLVALTLTFASFDWLMSLQPLWSSTMFGVYFFAGGFVASFGLLAMLAYAAQRAPASPALIRPPHFHALGRLMFAFSIFWAYCAFFQALLIQIADKPDEVSFYTARLTTGWDVVALLLLTLRFVVPFCALLPREIKFRPLPMALVGGLLLLGEYLDLLWLVSPMQPQRTTVISVWDIAALVALSSSCVAFAAWRLRGRSWAPLGDPQLLPSALYRSPI